jgi:eukaryotic-like serine/threonine-protein kinase
MNKAFHLLNPAFRNRLRLSAIGSLLVFIFTACSPQGNLNGSATSGIDLQLPTVFVSSTPTIALSATPSRTPTLIPSTTPFPSPTSTLKASATPTQTVLPANFRINPKDGSEFVYVEAGEFTMGSDPNTDPDFWGAEGPVHQVYLDGYWIQRTEVTNALYQRCVSEKSCPLPASISSYTTPNYYGNPDFDGFPVVNVSWSGAQSYCRWIGGRLPTEAEWEKAARGTDGRRYPWGEDSPSGELVNYCDRRCTRSDSDPQQDDGYSELAPVGSFPLGASPYGVLDMAGNVWEWTADWFRETYYRISPDKNPLGPASGSRRVVRGGAWLNPDHGLRTTARASFRSTETMVSVGFRCVVDE